MVRCFGGGEREGGDADLRFGVEYTTTRIMECKYPNNRFYVVLLRLAQLAWHCAGTYSKATGEGGSNGARMRFNPEASWGANAGLDVPRKALEDVKVCLSSAWDDFVGFSPCHCNLSPTLIVGLPINDTLDESLAYIRYVAPFDLPEIKYTNLPTN